MNSYCIIEENKNNIKITVNVKNLKLDKIKTNNTIMQISRRSKKKKDIEIETDLDLNSLYKDDNLRWSIVSSLNAAKIKNKDEKMAFVYNAACRYLDNEFICKNLCEFKDNVCLEKRKFGATNGCCHTVKNKFIWPILDSNWVLCEYQKNKSCTADCLGCKLFVCDSVKNKGIKFTVNNVPLIKYYFNFIQKMIILTNLFTHKDKLLKKLKTFN